MSTISVLPYTVTYACMVALNRNTLALLGGVNSTYISNEMLIFHLDTKTWERGPLLNEQTRLKVFSPTARCRRNDDEYKTAITFRTAVCLLLFTIYVSCLFTFVYNFGQLFVYFCLQLMPT